MQRNSARLSLLLLAFALTSCGPFKNSEKSITSFSFVTPPAAGIIDQEAKTISVPIPYGTDVTRLVATFVTTGTKVTVGTTEQVSGTTLNAFTSPVGYTVTAADGTTALYTVTVTPAPSSAKEITGFSFEDPAATGVIDQNAKTINVTIPHGTDVTVLIATFTTTGKNITVGTVVQVSGTTPNDFTSPAPYTVTAEDGTTSTYTVTVAVALNSAKALGVFIFTDPVAAGVIDQSARTVAVSLPYGADLTALVATFTMTGAVATVQGIMQTSGITPNDFTNPVQYIISADDGSSATYEVTVTTPAQPPLDVCLGGPVVIGRQDVRMLVSAPSFTGLELTLGMKETAYSTDRNCVPVYLEVANKRTVPVTLSAVQAGKLSALSSALYGPASLMSGSLAYSAGVPIAAGSIVNPGEHIVLLSLFSRDRLTLDSVPPLGGGVVSRALNVQAPFGSGGSLSVKRLDFTFDLDFGSLPLSRVADPGAGTSFVEGQLIVGFTQGMTLAEAEAIVAQKGCHIISVNWSITAVAVSIPFDKTTGQMITSFTSEPKVRYAERNYIVSAL